MVESNKHIAIKLANEEYAIPVRQVREIVGVLPATVVPGTAPHVLGVMNLRGKVVPVLDLRARLGLPRATIAPRSCIVVCQGPAGQIGLLVDSVLEVVYADVPRTLWPAAARSVEAQLHYIRGN